MRSKLTLGFFITFIVFSFSSLSAQEATIWPGDVNDNGAVNGIDMLHWSYAYGRSGSKRPNATSDWAAQLMGEVWQDTFPNNRNFAYADADGDGRVTGRDLNLLFQHQARTRASAQNHSGYVLPDTTGEHEAILRLVPAGYQLTPSGTEMLLDVVFEGRGDTLFRKLNGVTFRASLPEGIFADYRGYEEESFERALKGTKNLLRWVTVDSTTAQLAVTVSSIVRRNYPTAEPFARFVLPLSAGTNAEDLDGLSLTIDSLLVVDSSFQTRQVATDTLMLENSNDCSLTVNPVCGSDGVTYLNGCFAEAAGVTDYTPGACWHPALTAADIDPNANCPTAYEPVCGFNGVTYANACAAEAAGVSQYSAGVCASNDLSCYDPSLIVLSNGTSLNLATGVIDYDCSEATGGGVCGCDGQQYPSACAAEAAGIRTYTAGSCSDACIDPTQISDTEDCGDTTDFVCGCNDETYINACYAEAAGVMTYTAGPCNGTSNWCDEASVIHCGDYLPNETTRGAGNQIINYPGTSGGLQQGPDRVYTFQKTSAGDLQVGLEIMTPGLNMNLFLVTGDCSDYRVVGASTTSNNQTNNEGIVLEDAPNGTYYIIVDAPAAGPGGDYRLELSCGYLDCSERVPLTCGVTYNGTNADGTDDVSTYTCGPVLNVENNGPEIVHTFTVTESGPVNINLTGLSANLELFLLSECDRGRCLQYSQEPGTNPEHISRDLAPGTYYVVVDGYNGAISDYSLTVDCTAGCNLSVTTISQTNTSCGQAGGSISLQVTGGSPSYTAHYVGPVCRSAISDNGRFDFDDLPPGTYTTRIEDRNGCEYTFTFTITSSDGGLDGTMTATDSGCGQVGKIEVDLTTTGTTPYTVYLSGTINTTLNTSSNSFTISPLGPGTYTVTIVDAGGCSFAETLTVGQSAGTLDITTWSEPAGCDGSLGQIVVRTNGSGTLPYTIRLSGPVTGGQIVNGYNFRIRQLPAGQYHFTLTDAEGCSFQENIVVEGGELEAQISATPANCGVPGAARVNISAGTAPYTINYTGPVSGSVTTDEAITVIDGLSSGTYNFSIWSDDGCDLAETIFVTDGGGTLDFTVTQAVAACDGNDSQLQLTINGGTPNYTVNYSGDETGSLSVDGTGTATLSLPPGTYSFTATDFGGCSATYELTVTGGLETANQQSFLFGNGCGQRDNIRTVLSQGEAPFAVVVSSPCADQDTSFVSTSSIFELQDLPNCAYTITVTDAVGCQSSRTITVAVDPDSDILQLTAQDGACGGNGRIDLEITAGEFPYFISWTGPENGSVNLAAQEYSLLNLPAGTYTFTLTNDDGCDATRSITLQNDGDLEVVSSIIADDCGAPDQIWNDIVGGVGPYTVAVTRLCDSTSIDVVENNSAGFEIIDVQPCCYAIVVTDVNGCQTTSTVCVDPYNLFNAIATDGVCGQAGSLRVVVMNSVAEGPYTIQYSGAGLDNTINSIDGDELITDLPAGTYTVTVSDANGCMETETVVIEDIPSDLTLNTALISNDCGQYNQLWNDISGGEGPYSVEVIRLCDGVTDTTFTQDELGFELTNLEECEYKIIVVDATGCMVMTTTTVEGGEPELFSLTPISGPCGEAGRIDLSFTRGTAPYTVSYTGPQSGGNTVNGNMLSINDAPPGTYTFVVTDANDCTETESVTLEATTNDLTLTAALISNDCGQYNQIWVDIFNGTGPFAVEVIRLCDGTTMTDFVTGDVGFELTELPPCDYKIIITDAAGCMVMDTITVFPAPVDLFDLVAVSGECNAPGSFTLQITGGRAPYTIVYTGPVNDSLVTNNLAIGRDDLPSGDYTIFVTDSIGCIETDQFSINNTTTDLDLVTSLIFNDCGQLNQLWSDINGGQPPFTVEVTRLCDNTIDTSFTTSEREFELLDRMPCEYKIKVTDAAGCMDMETERVQSTSANLFNVTIDNSCDSSGFHLDFIAGEGPYRVVISGPLTSQFLDVEESLYIPAPPGDYSLRAWSANGCSEMTFSGLVGGGTGDLPEVDFTTEGGDLAVTFRNESSLGTPSWDFGDGTTSTEENPQHLFASAGTYNVCLTIINDCGSSEFCQEITVAASGNAQIVIGGDRSFMGGSVRIPVSIQGVDNLATIAGTFELEDPNLATFTHVTAGAILPQFNPSNNSFSFVADGASGIPLNGSINVLFFIHLELGNALGETALELANGPVALEVSSVQNGVPILLQPSYLPGFVEVSANLLGNISSLAHTVNGDEVEEAEYELSEPDGSYVITLPRDADGIPTTLAGLNLGRMYYIEPVKDEDPRNGLSSFEIFLAQRWLLGYEVPQITSPLQIVAADMNCSQSFSNLDLYLMERLLINDLDEVPGCDTWTFVPESHQFAEDWNRYNIFPAPRRAEVVLEHDTMVMFTGLKTGDILGDADPGRSSGILPLTVETAADLTPGTTQTLLLRLPEERSLVSLQGVLQAAPGLEIVAVTPAGDLPSLSIGMSHQSRGKVLLSWYSNTGESRALAAGAELVEVAVRVTADYQPTASPLTFANDDALLDNMAYDGRQRQLLPKIEFRSEERPFQLYPAAPNPAADYTDIRFDLPVAERVSLTVFDALGRPVIRREQLLSAGPNRFRLDLRSLPGGAYQYQLRAGEAVGTGKLVRR